MGVIDIYCCKGDRVLLPPSPKGSGAMIWKELNKEGDGLVACRTKGYRREKRFPVNVKQAGKGEKGGGREASVRGVRGGDLPQ